jgi:hypothetical protein
MDSGGPLWWRLGVAKRFLSVLALVARCWNCRLEAQSAPAALPIPLLGRLIGRWTMTGTVRTHPASGWMRPTVRENGSALQITGPPRR